MCLSCVPNVARPVSVFILCTQCCQASVCLYIVYSVLSGQGLFLSCVTGLVRAVSVFILCTQCCPKVHSRIYNRQTLAWLHWVYKIKTDTGLATLGKQDKNRHWPGNIGYTRQKQILAWQHWVHKIKTDTHVIVPHNNNSSFFSSVFCL
jgi:hypothetical protein